MFCAYTPISILLDLLGYKLKERLMWPGHYAATKTIFDAAETFCADLLANTSFMLSCEMRDIDPELSPKTSSIRRYIPGESS